MFICEELRSKQKGKTKNKVAWVRKRIDSCTRIDGRKMEDYCSGASIFPEYNAYALLQRIRLLPQLRLL
jgi:hypothetical protein